MQNPLVQFLPVEDRVDGVYLKIPREKKGRISCENIFAVLEKAQVTNYDRNQIEKVVNHARGVPEKIGPLFEYYEQAVEKFISVAVSDTSASMKIDPAFHTAGIALTHSMTAYCLKRKGIRFGLLEENIKKTIEDNLYDKEVVIAKSIEPVDGQDAQIKYEIDLGKTLRPETRRDGSADFREVHTFTQVKEGQVLARKIPPTNGKPGKRVTGEIIPSKPGNDIDLPRGSNTSLAEKDLALVASKTGLLKTEGSLLTISDQLVIEKNVDFSVGNIKYAGDLTIKGNVKPGFTIEAEGNIEIQGVVESASVKSRNGTVTIKKGVLGKSDAFIYGKSGIEVLFAQEATLETEGKIVIERHCLHCECQCDIFEAVQPQSNLVGGKIKLSSCIFATQIGNSKGIDTKIILFDTKKDEAQAKLKEYKELKEKVMAELRPVKKQVSTKAAIFKSAGNLITDRQKAELKKWVDTYNVMNLKLKRVQEQIDSVTETIKSPSSYDGFVRVTGDIFPGTILEMYGRRKIINHRVTAKTYRIDKNGEITSEG